MRIPPYQRTTPTWGFQFTSSLRAMGTKSFFLRERVKDIRGFTLSAEWQPASLQKAGILSFGPSVSVYPELPGSSLARNRLAMWSIGGQARYQFRYWREQPLVPYAGLGFEVFNYRFNNGATGHLRSIGGVGGAMLLLNVFEPSGAAAFYANYGVSRSYLVAEFRGYSGSDVNVALGGASFFFGIRLEY